MRGIGGARSLVRYHRGLCYGNCTVFWTLVYPFEQSYVALVQPVGQVDAEADWDTLSVEAAQGNVPADWDTPIGALELLARSLRFEAHAGATPWEEAVALILDGRVTQVLQTHALTVTLHLDDGSTVTVVEPAIDDVFDVVARCGDVCNDLILATE
jgi:hypothetical protein